MKSCGIIHILFEITDFPTELFAARLLHIIRPTNFGLLNFHFVSHIHRVYFLKFFLPDPSGPASNEKMAM